MLEALIDVSLGRKKADFVIKDVNIVNVCSGEIYETDIAIYRDRIAGLGSYGGKNEVDGRDKYAIPGLIDGHTHIEMSMLSVSEFAKIVVPGGTTTVIEDPHEIANVLGVGGIKLMAEEARTTPLKVFFMAPSCVPSTEMETSGASLNSEEIKKLLEMEEVIGLAEMMNYVGVINKDKEVWDKLGIARGKSKPIDGHAPMLRGKELNAYISAGIGSDHESSSYDEALEKLRLGMRIMIREGSTVKSLADLAPLAKKYSGNCMLVTDGDRIPNDLLQEGCVDWVIRRAIEYGIDPVTAIQMCTINPAEYFGLHEFGTISPGKIADIVLLDDLEGFKVDKVVANGKIVGEIGRTYKYPSYVKEIHAKPVKETDFHTKTGKARIIGVRDGEIITDEIIKDVSGIDVNRDILKIAVIERHGKTGNINTGFARGFGLRRGAIASSVAHDSHNIITVGASERDMATSVNRLIEIGGGFVLAENGDIHELPLPIAGLMSEDPAERVAKKIEELSMILTDFMGCELSSPFITMSFLALPVIPKLKLTDKGLVDVQLGDFVDLVE
jgi:adenine deaminase